MHTHAIKKGFTLIELLVVIGIIAILFAVVLVVVNPAQRFAQTRDARRITDVNSILNAVLNKTVDNKGTLPDDLETFTPTTVSGTDAAARTIVRMIGTADSGTAGDSGLGNDWACGGPSTETTGKYTLYDVGAAAGSNAGRCATATNCDVTGLMVNPGDIVPAYLAVGPIDPKGSPYAGTNSGYAIQNVCNTADCTGSPAKSGRIKVVACYVETSQDTDTDVDTVDTIEVTR